MSLNIRGLHHDHIDGSRAILDVLSELHVIAGTECRFNSAEDIRTYFASPLENIVGKFSVVTGLMQTVEALEMVGYAYGKRRACEGYRYVEGKFAPQYHTFRGLSLKEVVPLPVPRDSIVNLSSALLFENNSKLAVPVLLNISNLGETEAKLPNLVKPSKATEPSTSRSPETRTSLEAEIEPA